MKHKHHIIPKHLGGSDEESNLVELTIEEHAEAHKKLYEKYGRWEDKLAWQGLAGLVTKEELVREMLSESGKKGATKGNANRKGMKYRPYTRSKGSTQGLKWYHNPSDPTQRSCFKEGADVPDGWVRGQGKKATNPGLNFHAKKNNDDGVEIQDRQV